MNINRLTQKAQEAVIAAQTLALRNGQPEIGTLHLLQALVDQPQGVVPHLLGRMGVDTRALAGATTIELDRLPKVAGATEPGVSRALRDTVLAAHEEIAQFGDQFVSTEHLLLTLLGHGDAKTRAVLADAKVTRDRILKALQDIRGSQRVTSQQPEGTYDALSQNGRDRTAEAHALAGL